MGETAAASAPAKAMLFGEYAVLEGGPALALAFDRRIRVEASRGARAWVMSELLPGRLDLQPETFAGPAPHPVLRFVWPLLQAAQARAPGIQLRFEADFPPVWGLGSSSASTLAAAAALRRLDGLDGGHPALFAEAVSRQRDVQGAASGYDVATQLVGGCALFRPGDPPAWERPAPEAEGWIWGVAWTGSKVSTGSMIRDARRRHSAGAPIYGRIRDLAEVALGHLRGGDREGVGEAMNEGQRLIVELGACPSPIGEVVRTLAGSDGVLGARLSGAGGGDCIVLLADDRDAAAAAVEARGLTLLDLEVDLRGLLVEGPEA